MVGPRALVQQSSDTDGHGDDDSLPVPTCLLKAVDHRLVTQDLDAFLSSGECGPRVVEAGGFNETIAALVSADNDIVRTKPGLAKSKRQGCKEHLPGL